VVNNRQNAFREVLVWYISASFHGDYCPQAFVQLTIFFKKKIIDHWAKHSTLAHILGNTDQHQALPDTKGITLW